MLVLVEVVLVPLLLVHLFGEFSELLLLEVPDPHLLLDEVVPDLGHRGVVLEHLCVEVGGSIKHEPLLLDPVQTLLDVVHGDVEELDLPLDIVVDADVGLELHLLISDNHKFLGEGVLLLTELVLEGSLDGV